MNKNNNTEEIKDAKGEVVRTLVFTDKDGVRTYKDKDTGETVKTLNICNGGVSDEQVKVWKGEHRKVHMIEVEDDGDLFVGYFRRPSMETMSAVNQLTKKDEVKSTSVMFENCWLGGDPVITSVMFENCWLGGDPVMKTDTLVRMAAIKQLGAMFDRVVGTLKNV